MTLGLTIGDVTVPGRVLTAPMTGITDLPFRRIALRFGADVVVTEMVASDALAVGDVDATVRLAGEGVTTHVVQIAGREPAATARAAAAGGPSQHRQADGHRGWRHHGRHHHQHRRGQPARAPQ